jgi:hypothetical protein
MYIDRSEILNIDVLTAQAKEELEGVTDIYVIADTVSQIHRAAFEHDPFGEIKEAWRDGNGVLCIRYENGEWYHYPSDGGWY